MNYIESEEQYQAAMARIEELIANSQGRYP